MALSVPLVNCFTHPFVPGPVLASHPLDLQDFSSIGHGAILSAHVGPPSVNTEAKLVGVDDALVENGGDPVGMLLIRGPSVGKMFHNDDYVSIPSEEDKEEWIATGVRAKIQTNGAFQVLNH
jgi:long-chain acyl-CoA synthetase